MTNNIFNNIYNKYTEGFIFDEIEETETEGSEEPSTLPSLALDRIGYRQWERIGYSVSLRPMQ